MPQKCQLSKFHPVNVLLVCFLLLAALTIVGIIFYFVIKLIISLTDGIDVTVGAGIAATFIAGIFSIPSLFFSRHFERRHQQLETLREHKTELYIKLSRLFFDLLKSIKSDKTKQEKEYELNKLVDKIYDCNQELIVWGSDDVVSKFIAYRENVKNPDLIFQTMGDLFLSIRQDLGHQNKNLTPEELLKIFIDTSEINKNR